MGYKARDSFMRSYANAVSLSPDPHAIREQNPHAYAGGMIEFNITSP